MIVPSRDAKTYGVLHTENYFSFFGFSKKVNSEEIQKVDIYLDDNLIDTIEANLFIEKIEDIYDVQNFAFEYNLPEKYIGEKHTISFKNRETQEELQNSPYELIQKNHHKFNEYRFLWSLTQPIDQDKIKDIYCPNSIGFLATEENLSDKEFVEYINQIMNDFPKEYFKALIFNPNLITNVKEKFNQQSLEMVILSDIVDVFHNVEVYLSNNDKNELDTKILLWHIKHFSNVFCVGLNLNLKNITIKIHELNNPNYFQKFFDNLEYLEFDNNDISKYGKTFHEIFFKKACEIYGVDIEFDMNQTVSKAYVYWNLKLGLINHEFFRYALEFGRKFAKLQ